MCVRVCACMGACNAFTLPLFGGPFTTPKRQSDPFYHVLCSMYTVHWFLSRPSAVQRNAATTVCFAWLTCAVRLVVVRIACRVPGAASQPNFHNDSLGSTGLV